MTTLLQIPNKSSTSAYPCDDNPNENNTTSPFLSLTPRYKNLQSPAIETLTTTAVSIHSHRHTVWDEYTALAVVGKAVTYAGVRGDPIL